MISRSSTMESSLSWSKCWRRRTKTISRIDLEIDRSSPISPMEVRLHWKKVEHSEYSPLPTGQNTWGRHSMLGWRNVSCSAMPSREAYVRSFLRRCSTWSATRSLRNGSTARRRSMSSYSRDMLSMLKAPEAARARRLSGSGRSSERWTKRIEGSSFASALHNPQSHQTTRSSSADSFASWSSPS